MKPNFIPKNKMLLCLREAEKEDEVKSESGIILATTKTVSFTENVKVIRVAKGLEYCEDDIITIKKGEGIPIIINSEKYILIPDNIVLGINNEADFNANADEENENKEDKENNNG